MSFRTELSDNVCSLMPLWKALFVLEFVFLSLLILSILYLGGEGLQTSLIALNLVIILPTMAALVLVIRHCGRVD